MQLNGGFLTSYFNISRGVRQGCPLSPLLFILAVELLAVKIRQDPDYRGISLPDGQEIKISQFADDTTIITENVKSLKPHLQILDRFGNISGLKLNKKKTKAMWMGSMKDSNLKVLDFFHLMPRPQLIYEMIHIFMTTFASIITRNSQSTPALVCCTAPV